ncbi:MAG: TatD family hydrolase [Chitinispirillales bacterium]|jgi:TatD DNase family protein|nr:TatD family hydrolase [Chitinispirillales bacterium]
MTDTHAHLYDRSADELQSIVADAVNAGVDTIINTAVSIQTAKIVLDQCDRFPQNLRAAIGISPFDTNNLEDGWDSELTELLYGSPSAQSIPQKIAAIGEIGLDGTNPAYPAIDVQAPVFIRQLEIAVTSNLPAVIHSRGIEKRAAEICRDIGVKKAVFHCFTGDADALECIVDNGYYISISGIITYKNSHLRELIKSVPIDNLLIETDTPYLSPVPHRGKPNRPSFLTCTAAEIARLLDINEPELIAALKKNTAAIFPNIY